MAIWTKQSLVINGRNKVGVEGPKCEGVSIPTSHVQEVRSPAVLYPRYLAM